MKSSILLTILAVLVLSLIVPALVYAETEQMVTGNPPISQPLVREGTIALKLVETFHLGSVSSEAEAERALGAIGIAPRNGWIADYPVTPDIVGELQKAVTDAADSKRLAMSRDEASRAFQDVMVAYDLSVRPYAGDQIAGNTGSYVPDTTVINNYYYDEGPPVVTYYAPPLDYAYLYSWVAYPFWWYSFWFPGFFVLADFDIHVHGHGFHGHDGAHFSNHFRDHRSGAIARIDPANRAHGGTFAARGGTGWTSQSARSGAQAIYNNSGSRNFVTTGGSRTAVSPATTNSGNRSGSSNRTWNRTSRPTSGGATMWSSPSASGRYGNSRSHYNTSRSSNVSSGGRTLSGAHSSGGRTFQSTGTRSYVPSSGRTYSGLSGGSASFHSGGGSMRSFGGSWRR